HVEGDLRILRNADGNEIGVEGFYREVSDRIALQQFVEASSDRVIDDVELFAKLKATNEFQIDYLMSLGHQLKTPLAALRETMRNIQDGISNRQDQNVRIRYAIGQIQVCLALVRNLSFLDRILLDQPLTQRVRPVSLAKLAIDAKLNLLHLLQDK